MNEHNSEIDLIELLVKVINFIKKYFILLIIFIILGIIANFFYPTLSKDYYESKLIATTYQDNNIYKTEIIVEIINKLDEKINKHSLEELSTDLNIDKKDALNIKKINATIIENENIEINNFTITAEVYDDSVFTILSEGIAYYLSNNNHVKNIIEIEKQTNIKLIKKYKQEIHELDSFQDQFFNNKIAKSQVSIINSDVSYYNDLLTLYKEQLALENQNKLLSPIIIITDFTRNKVSQKKTTISFSIILFFFVIFGFSLSIIIELIKFSNKYEKK